MSYFLKKGNTFFVTSKEALDIHNILPAGNYLVKSTPLNELYLESTDSFVIPTKMYGDTVKNTNRILNTFKNRPANTGVLLCGEKGSGKTLLAKAVCNLGAYEGIPTIVINAPWHGDNFNTLIQTIEQPCIVLFDEFEKVYDLETQPSMLTLLDGVFSSKKLFILTCNDKWRVDSHMRNRPGRIFYMLDFDTLTSEFIKEYCEDNLDNKSQIESVVEISAIFNKFNFDMLKALVEEMNRYNEPAQEAMRILNTKPEFSDGSEYTYSITIGNREMNTEYDDECGIEGKWRGNPIKDTVQVDFRKPTKGKKEGWEFAREIFHNSDLKKIDRSGSGYMFDNGRAKIILQKITHEYRSWQDAF